MCFFPLARQLGEGDARLVVFSFSGVHGAFLGLCAVDLETVFLLLGVLSLLFSLCAVDLETVFLLLSVLSWLLAVLRLFLRLVTDGGKLWKLSTSHATPRFEKSDGVIRVVHPAKLGDSAYFPF